MPTVWRLTPSAFAGALDGEGSSLVSGRWNSPGVAMVYTSSHLSLAVLEVFVHIPALLRDDLDLFEAVRVDIPDDAAITRIDLDQFEAMLTASDPLAACRAAGDRWITQGRDLVLAAPSVVVPEELNLMLNPAHPRMGEVAIASRRRFRFDMRLFGGARRQ